MSSSIALTRNNYKITDSQFRRVSCFSILKHWFNFKNYRLVLILLIVSAIFFYLFQLNSLYMMGFEKNDLEKELNRLTGINRSLKLEVTQTQSIDKISELSGQWEMVKIYQAEYISANPSTVAAR